MSPYCVRAGPRSSGGSRSPSPGKRRTTGKAPAKPAGGPAADGPSAAAVAAKAAESADAAELAAAALAAGSGISGGGGGGAAAADPLQPQRPAAADPAMFAPAAGDDPMIADAKRIAAEVRPSSVQ